MMYILRGMIMKKSLLAISFFSSILSLSAREILCEQCEAEPECCEGQLFVERSQFYISGEFLYWTAEAPALHYALHQDEEFTAPLATGKYEIADYDWRPGFRAALCYYRCPKYWELTAEYTWLFDSGSDHVDQFLRPTKFITNTNADFLSARSTIDLHYHIGDLYVARVFDPNPHLRIRLLGGLTTGYIEQSWKICYKNILEEEEKLKEKWHFFGGGIRLGVRGDWFWGCQFYLTGKTTFATLIGSYTFEDIQKDVETNTFLANAKYEDHRFSMHTQFLLGPSWQIPCECWSFELFAGYELNIWFNIHEWIRLSHTDIPTDSTETFYANGLFGVQGLTLRLNIGF